MLRHSASSIISKHSIDIHIQWVPAHIEIKENAADDQLTKRGTNLPQFEIPVPYGTVCKMIKSNLQEEWLNEWATGRTARNMNRHMNGPHPTDDLNKLPRLEQSIIFQNW